MSDFVRVTGREPHFERTRLLLANHPEVRELVGNAPVTSVAIFGIVGLQLLVAWLLRGQPWWMILIVAYGVGAFADHALWTLVHECTHNLVFRKTSENSLIQLVANIPSVIPSAIAFRRYHLLHHDHQGDEDLDADAADGQTQLHFQLRQQRVDEPHVARRFDLGDDDDVEIRAVAETHSEIDGLFADAFFRGGHFIGDDFSL